MTVQKDFRSDPLQKKKYVCIHCNKEYNLSGLQIGQKGRKCPKCGNELMCIDLRKF